MPKIIGKVSNGLMGTLFPGTYALVKLLNAHTPAGCHFDLIGDNDPRVEQAVYFEQLDAAHAAGDIPMLIGHSLGGNLVWDYADHAKAKGIRLPLAISIDPVQWRSNGPAAGQWIVPNNVAVGMNFRQEVYPGGGYISAEDPSVTRISDKTMDQYPHAAQVGYDICSNPTTQTSILVAVQHAAAQIIV